MLEGLEEIAAEQGVEGLQLVLLDAEPTPEPIPSGPFFAHNRAGENKDPQSKIDEFAETIREGMKVQPDIAFMKFCYVDFTPETDTAALFAEYQSTLKELGDEYPDIATREIQTQLQLTNVNEGLIVLGGLASVPAVAVPTWAA